MFISNVLLEIQSVIQHGFSDGDFSFERRHTAFVKIFLGLTS